MIGNGMGTRIGRFEVDFVLNCAGVENSISVQINPSGRAIFSGNQTTDTGNITFASGVPYPGPSGVVRHRCLAACLQVMWPGSEQNRRGIIALGNIAAGNVPVTGATTPSEIRSAMPFVSRMPDQLVGIKWRPNESDLEWHDQSFSRDTVLVASISGLLSGDAVRVRYVAVHELDESGAAGLGQIASAYPPQVQDNAQDLWSKALRFLDSTGNWLLDNASAIGHVGSNAIHLLTM